MLAYTAAEVLLLVASAVGAAVALYVYICCIEQYNRPITCVYVQYLKMIGRRRTETREEEEATTSRKKKCARVGASSRSLAIRRSVIIV